MRMISFLMMFLVSLTTFAALPPLSQADREMDSSHIVEGKVVSMTTDSESTRPGFMTTHFHVTLLVTKVVKGVDMSEGDTVVVSYRKISMPEGYSGNGGQYRSMKVNDMVTAYMTSVPFKLLEPNGFDVKK